MSAANEQQVGGTHYQSEYQHWDFALGVLGNRYLEGQITKYVTRWRKKNGVQDLRKALHFLDKLIEAFEAGMVAPLRTLRHPNQDAVVSVGVAQYLAAHPELETDAEQAVIRLIANWMDGTRLRDAHRCIRAVIHDATPDGEATTAYVKQD